MTELLIDFSEYQRKALRTLRSDPHLTQILHCTMGMVGEAGELKEVVASESVKVIAEIGDCMWYAANLANLLNLDLTCLVGRALALNIEEDTPHVLRSGEDRALIWGCRMTDLVKKSWFYGKELDSMKVTFNLTHYWASLLSVCAKLSVSPIYVATVNIRKLEARFPDKMFNAEQAINRDCEAEAKASFGTLG